MAFYKEDMDLYVNQLENLKKERNEAEEKINNLFPKNIDHLRRFHLQLITMSLIILAAVLPLLSSENQAIFKTEVLTYAGIVFIFISLILTVLYLTHILISENKRLTNKRDFYSQSFSNEINKVDNCFRQGMPYKDYYKNYLERAGDYAKREKELNKISKIAKKIDIVGWILSIVFLVGTFLIGFSFLNFYGA